MLGSNLLEKRNGRSTEATSINSSSTPTKTQTESQTEIHSEKERRRVLRKIDWHLLPLLSLLYLLSFLDRSNIGNARIAGMARDVQLTGLRYNVVAAVFFIPYALAEVPSNICLKLVRPSRWIPATMVAWGIVMTLMCLCRTYEGLIIARAFLGLTEAGLFPGAAFYLSFWYRKRDIARRISIFFAAASLAGAFSGLLAYGIQQMEGIGGLHGWQWIFCLEGLATIVVAVLAFFLMYDNPETAGFLTGSEKQLVVTMLKEDTQGQARHFSFTFVWQALRDYKTYIQVGIYTGILVPIYAIALFLPTIVNELGFSTTNAQLLSVPVFVAGCITLLIFAGLSDKYNIRGPFIIGGGIVAMVGFIVVITQSRAGVAYFGTVLAAMGLFPMPAVDLAWAGSAAGGEMRRGVTLAMVIGMGNLGGVCSSFIYFNPPRFFVGHGTSMGFLGLTVILSCIAMWDYNRLNKKKIALCEREGIDDSRWEEFANMGSESPLFRYTL